MGRLSKLLKKEKPPELSPLARVEAAVDELNYALKELRKEEEYRRYRAWVRQADPRCGLSSKVMIGYWDANVSRFIVMYDGD